MVSMTTNFRSVCYYAVLKINVAKQKFGAKPHKKTNFFLNLRLFGLGGGGTTRPLPRDGGAEELRGDPTVGPHPKV